MTYAQLETSYIVNNKKKSMKLTCLVKFQKLVIQNKDILAQLRTSFDKPDVMRDLFRRLISKCSLVGKGLSGLGMTLWVVRNEGGC